MPYKYRNNWVPPFIGIIHATGEPDTGKTMFGLTVPGVTAADLVFIDCDVKGKTTKGDADAAGVQFFYYADLADDIRTQKVGKPIDFYGHVDHMLTEIESLIQTRGYGPKALLFDDWIPFENAINAFADTQVTAISDLRGGQATASFAWPYKRVIYAQQFLRLLNIAPVVTITTHIKEKWGSPGVLQAKGQEPLTEKSILRIWFRHNPSGMPQPVGLVLKRVNRTMYTDDGIKPVNVLPRKLTPCTWENITYFLANPVGNRRPLPEELPDEFELSILDGTLTNDQKNALKASARSSADAAADEVSSFLASTVPPDLAITDLPKEARRLRAEGMVLPQIAAALKVSIPQVVNWLAQPAA